MTTLNERQALIDDCKIYVKVGINKEVKELAKRCADMLEADAKEIQILQAEVDLYRAACDKRDEALAALKQQAEVPQGWKLVPVEATNEMLLAGTRCMTNAGFNWYHYQWAAMLAAAPQPPQGERVPQKVVIDYTGLYDFADKNKISYNELCAAVNAALINNKF